MSFETSARVRWWLGRFVAPLGLLAALAACIGRSPIDRASLVPFFDEELAGFALRRSWLFEGVLHRGGRGLVATATLLALLAASWSSWQQRRRVHAGRLAYLATCVLLTSAIAGSWKALAEQVTPWKTLGFGGSEPWPDRSGVTPQSLLGSPGAHAASGYAWVALYFVGASLKSRHRWQWLMPGLWIGTLFAMGQHVRGAHPPSHEPLSLAIAWFVAGSTAVAFRACGWLDWEERDRRRDPASHPPFEPALPCLAGISAALAAVSCFALDQIAGRLGQRDAEPHSALGQVELSGAAVGCGLAAWFVAQRIERHRTRRVRPGASEAEA